MKRTTPPLPPRPDFEAEARRVLTTNHTCSECDLWGTLSETEETCKTHSYPEPCVRDVKKWAGALKQMFEVGRKARGNRGHR
jgi:hypothetical protein